MVIRKSTFPQKVAVNNNRAATAGKHPRAWALLRFWVSLRFYNKQPDKKLGSRIFGVLNLASFLPSNFPCLFSTVYTANVYRDLWFPIGFSAISMEKGCKSKLILLKRKKNGYVVGKPCNTTYRLQGNPMITIGFSYYL